MSQVDDVPSIKSYVALTYVYHAIDGYAEYLARHDKWVAMEHLYLNLGSRGVEDVVDPPDVLARIAKEVIQGSVQRQADVTAAMANRLGRDVVDQLWSEQTAWRKAHPDDWWSGVPDGWSW